MKPMIETRFATVEEHAQQLANSVAEQLAQVLQEKDKAVLAVSGGRSPIPFFEALSQVDLAWEQVIISLVDERVVDIEDNDSNTALVGKHLLINRAKKAQFHGLLAANLSTEQLTDVTTLAESAQANFIQPDIIVLGMGEDGHTASLFPHVADLAAPQAILSVVPQTAPYTRLSLSLPAILQAKTVYLAIGGAAKIAVYQAAKAQKTADLPISYVLHQNETAVKVLYHD